MEVFIGGAKELFAAFPFYLKEIEFDGITHEVIKCKCHLNDFECPALVGATSFSQMHDMKKKKPNDHH